MFAKKQTKAVPTEAEEEAQALARYQEALKQEPYWIALLDEERAAALREPVREMIADKYLWIAPRWDKVDPRLELLAQLVREAKRGAPIDIRAAALSVQRK